MKKMINTVFLMLFSMSILFAQIEDEIVVKSEVGQINVAIDPIDLLFNNKKMAFTVEVTDNEQRVENVYLENNKQPIHLILISDIGGNNSKINKLELKNQLKKLMANKNFIIEQLNVIEGFDFNYTKTSRYPTHSFNNVNSAISNALKKLSTLDDRRKGVLVLTDRYSSLSEETFNWMNEQMGNSSYLLYVFNLNEKDYKKKDKTIARTNINGGDIVMNGSMLAGLFRNFTKFATQLYPVAFEIEKEDEVHKIEVIVRRSNDRKIVARNIRTFKADTKVIGGKQEPSILQNVNYKTSSDKDIAIAALKGKTLGEILQSRPEKLSENEVNKYQEELRTRPEMKNIQILSDEDVVIKNLRQSLEAVLKAFGRENYTKIFVYKGDSPFVGLYRECIIVISSGTLKLLNATQLRVSVAHELAHEIFMEDLRQADQLGNNNLFRIVEHKCDLVSAMVAQQLNENPFSIVEVDKIFRDWYERNPPKSDIGYEKFPSNKGRKNCIEEFLGGK